VLRLCGTSQLSRAFRARFDMPPRQYLALVRQQDLDWHEARLITDGFDRDAFLWRQQRLGASAAHGPGMLQLRSSLVIRIKRSEIPNSPSI
jgi:hypothetical protein